MMTGVLVTILKALPLVRIHIQMVSRHGKDHSNANTGKSVIYHQDPGYLILGFRILDPENLAC